MKILVTGGSGLVGKYVVEELHARHTVEVLDLKPCPVGDVVWHRADILSLESVKTVVKDFDAVVHMAGIPHPLLDPPEKVFQVNTLGTFNVLEASALGGVSRFVFMSSESTLGFAFSRTRMWPEYVPIDENHPLRPQDPYGMSKASCELLCAGYTRTYGLQTICLRAPWIWVPEPEERETYRKLIMDYPAWPKNLWAFVHVGDVAQAVRLALETPGLDLHDIFFACADENWTDVKSRELMKQYYPETPLPPDVLPGRASLISSGKAKLLLDYQPRYSVADVFT